MATKLFTKQLAGLTHVPLKITTVNKTVAAALRDVANGPVRFFELFVDNMVTASVKQWIKIYNQVGNDWVASTSKPVIIVPVPAFTDQDADDTGTCILRCPTGLFFDVGLSVLACAEDGDEVTTDPSKQIDTYWNLQK